MRKPTRFDLEVAAHRAATETVIDKSGSPKRLGLKYPIRVRANDLDRVAGTAQPMPRRFGLRA